MPDIVVSAGNSLRQKDRCDLCPGKLTSYWASTGWHSRGKLVGRQEVHLAWEPTKHEPCKSLGNHKAGTGKSERKGPVAEEEVGCLRNREKAGRRQEKWRWKQRRGSCCVKLDLTGRGSGSALCFQCDRELLSYLRQRNNRIWLYCFKRFLWMLTREWAIKEKNWQKNQKKQKTRSAFHRPEWLGSGLALGWGKWGIYGTKSKGQNLRKFSLSGPRSYKVQPRPALVVEMEGRAQCEHVFWR